MSVRPPLNVCWDNNKGLMASIGLNPPHMKATILEVILVASRRAAIQ